MPKPKPNTTMPYLLNNFLIRTNFHLQMQYEKIAKPFEWKFTRKDLSELLERISNNNDGVNLRQVA